MSKVNRNEEGDHKMQFLRSFRQKNKNPSSVGKVPECAMASIVLRVLDKYGATFL